MTDQDKKNGTEQEIQEKKAAPKAEPASDSAGTDISFIKEKVKERPINKRKLLKRTMITASMAVIFGLIACFTFLVLEPVFSNWLYPEEEPEPDTEADDAEAEIPAPLPKLTDKDRACMSGCIMKSSRTNSICVLTSTRRNC